MAQQIVIIAERFGLKRVGGPLGKDVSDGTTFTTSHSYGGTNVVKAVADVVEKTAPNIRKMEIFFAEGRSNG